MQDLSGRAIGRGFPDSLTCSSTVGEAVFRRRGRVRGSQSRYSRGRFPQRCSGESRSHSLNLLAEFLQTGYGSNSLAQQHNSEPKGLRQND
jgi:hypothetical protein